VVNGSRRPRGYTGRQHETIGSDILSVMRVLKLPEQVLGAEVCVRLKEVDPKAWYPIEWLLDLMDRLDKAVGHCFGWDGRSSICRTRNAC
jgi:hypothetical protein